MSGSIEALTAALEANTAALNKIIASGGKPAAEKPAGAAAGSKPAGGKGATGKKGPTVEEIAKAFGEYLSIKDKDERETRKANVKAIVDYFGAPKATEIDPSNFAEALRYLQNYIDGETPEFDGGNGGEGESLV